MTKLSETQEQLLSDLFILKKDFAIKLEEIQALYMEIKSLNKRLLDWKKKITILNNK